MPEQPDDFRDADGAAPHRSVDQGQALDERLAAALLVSTSPAFETQVERERQEDPAAIDEPNITERGTIG